MDGIEVKFPPRFSGSKGSGGSATQTPDNLFSLDIIEVVFGVSEGPIKGLADGSKSFLIGDTPLMAQDGEYNFDDFKLKIRKGTEQGETIQSMLGGFGSSTTVNVPMEQNVPIVRQGLHTKIDYLDFRFVINRLMKSNKKGTFKFEGKFKVEYRKTGDTNWKPVHTLVSAPIPEFVDDVESETYRSDDSKKKDHISASAGDRQVFVNSTGTPYMFLPNHNGAIWITPGGTPTIKVLVNHASWNDVNPTYSNNGDGFNKATWKEKSAWGDDKSTTLFYGNSTNNPKNREQGDIWWNTTNNRVMIYNGHSWILAGSSYNTDKLDGDDDDDDNDAQFQLEDGCIVIKGKTTSAYVLEFRLPVDNFNGTYDLRATKLSDTNTTEKFFDITWESFQELTSKNYKFPGLATAHLVGKASDQFSSLPNMSGIYDGRIVKVPSNYNATTRAYSGAWDGTWILAYTNNPAFIVKDLIENDRYGINAYYPVTVNKWDIYDAGVWCDKLTSKGNPRFTFNKLIQDSQGCREAVDYICGIFGGRFFDDGNGTAVIRIDKDGDPVQIFSPENVVEGLFSYSFTEIQSRYNDIMVSFTNPDLNYQEDRRRVNDDDHIAEFGRIPLNFIAVGCNSVQEAITRARYKLVTSITETRLVNFKTIRKGLYLSPYDIILVSDKDMAAGLSGRVKDITGNRSFTLRDPLYIEPGKNYLVRFEVVDDSGVFKTLTYNLPTGTSGLKTSITVTSDLPSLPDRAVFTLETTDNSAVPQAYRVTSIDEIDGDSENVSISAVLMNRLKWDFVDGDASLASTIDHYDVQSKAKPAPVPRVRVKPNPVDAGVYGGNDLIIDWQPSPSKGIQKYLIQISRNNEPFATIAETLELKYHWNDVPEGEYQIRIKAVNVFGNSSKGRTISHRLIGDSDVGDDDLLDLRMVDQSSATVFETRSPKFEWSPSKQKRHKDYVVRIMDNTQTVIYQTTTKHTYFTWSFDQNKASNNGTAKRSFTVRVSSRDKYDRESPPTDLTVNNPAPTAPTIIFKGVSYNSVVLSYDEPDIRDWKGVLVYQSTSPGFSITSDKLVYKGSSNSITLPVTGGQSYYYKMAFFDVFGTQNLNYSDEGSISVPTVYTPDVVAPSIPSGLAMTSQIQSDGMVKLIVTWNANTEADLLGYDLNLMEGSGNYLSIPTNQTRWERLVLPNTLFTAKIRAFDNSNNKSNFSNPPVTHTTTKDTTAPAVPINFSAQGNFGTIYLQWSPNTEGDFKSYEIYESTTNTPPTTGTTATYTLDATVLTISGVSPNQTRYYWIRGVDTSGNKSAWSTVKSATGSNAILSDVYTPDAAAGTTPSYTSVVSTDIGGGVRIQITVTWAGIANATSYQLGVTRNGGSEAIVPAPDTAHVFNAIPGSSYSIRVRGVNPLGKAGNWSPTPLTFTATGDSGAPATPTGVVCRPGIDFLHFQWNYNTEPDMDHYDYYVLSAATPAPTSSTTPTASIGSNYINITNLAKNAQRWIWIRAVDTSGNASAWTAAVSGTASGLVTSDLSGLIGQDSFGAGSIALKNFSILDPYGADLFTSNGKIGTAAYIVQNGNNVLLSDIAANALQPTLRFVGTFTTPPTQTTLGSDWKQNAVYKNSTDGKSYVLTGSPLGWVPYIEDGKQFYITLESTAGTSMRSGQSVSGYLKAHLFKNGAEVTDQTPDSWFNWRRVSKYDSANDANWNSLHSGLKQVGITLIAATFFCDVISP